MKNTFRVMDEKQAALQLSKALNYTNAAKAAFESLVIEYAASYNSKNFLNGQIRRLAAVLNDIKGMVRNFSDVEILTKEFSDEYRIDAIVSMFLLLDEKGWYDAEAAVSRILLKRQKERHEETNNASA